MQKFKQAIPTVDQTRGFETDVVGRAYFLARELGLHPVTAWLQADSNADQTLVTVPVWVSRKNAVKRLLRMDKVLATKMWATALPVEPDPDTYKGKHSQTVLFGTTHSATVFKNGKESVVVFRTAV